MLVSALIETGGRALTAADERYAAALASAGGGAAADANMISLLSSYIFTPHTYVLFNSGGGADIVSMASSFPPSRRLHHKIDRVR